MGNQHSAELQDFENSVSRGGRGRQSTRSLPDTSTSSTKMRGKENEKGLIKALNMSSRRSKKIRSEKKEAANAFLRRDAGPYYAAPGPHRPGPRSLDLGPGPSQPPPLNPYHVPSRGLPSRSEKDDNWSDIASDVGYRKGREGREGRKRAEVNDLYFHHQRQNQSSLSRRDQDRSEMPPPPPPRPKAAALYPLPREHQATISAASVMSSEMWDHATASATPTPQSARRQLLTDTLHSSQASSPRKSDRESPWNMGGSRSPECDKLTIQCLKSELSRERQCRSQLEAKLEKAKEREERHRQKLERKLERERHSYERHLGKVQESYRAAYGNQLEKIAKELADATTKQSQYVDEIFELRAENDSLRRRVDELMNQMASSDWQLRKNMALFGAPQNSPGALNSFSSATRTTTRAHTLDKAQTTPGHLSSLLGSDPSLPSGPGASAMGSTSPPLGIGEGLVSQPPSFLGDLFTASSPNPFPPPPPHPSKASLPARPQQNLFPRVPLSQRQEDEDDVKDFTKERHDDSKVSEMETMREAGTSVVSLQERLLRGSLLASEDASLLTGTPKASPRNSDGDETPRLGRRLADDGYDTMTTNHGVEPKPRPHPLSNSSSGVCSETLGFVPLGQLPTACGSQCSIATPLPRLYRTNSAPPMVTPPMLRSGDVHRLIDANNGSSGPSLPHSLSLGDLADYVRRHQEMLLATRDEESAPLDRAEEGSPAALCHIPAGIPETIEALEASLDLDRSLNDSFRALLEAPPQPCPEHGPSTSPLRILDLDNSPLGPNASASAKRGKAILAAEMTGRRLKPRLRSPPSFTTSESEEEEAEEEEGAVIQAEWDRQLRKNDCGRCRYQPPSWKRALLGRRVFSRFGKDERSALAKFDFLEGEESQGAQSGWPSSSSTSSNSEANAKISKRQRRRRSRSADALHRESSGDSSLFLSDLAAMDGGNRTRSSESSLSFHCY